VTGPIQGGAAEAAQQLEAYFLRQVLSTMPKGAMFGGDSAAGSTLHGMFTEAIADAVAASGDVGLAAEIQTALEGTQPRELPLPESEHDPMSVADEITASRVRGISSSIESTENGEGQ
jgi:Rod binding domain-containing protein